MLFVAFVVPYTTYSASFIRLWQSHMTGWNFQRGIWTTTCLHRAVRFRMAADSGTTHAGWFCLPSWTAHAGFAAMMLHFHWWRIFRWWSNCSESAHSPLRNTSVRYTHRHKLVDSSTTISVFLCLSVGKINVILDLHVSEWWHMFNGALRHTPSNARMS